MLDFTQMSSEDVPAEPLFGLSKSLIGLKYLVCIVPTKTLFDWPQNRSIMAAKKGNTCSRWAKVFPSSLPWWPVSWRKPSHLSTITALLKDLSSLIAFELETKLFKTLFKNQIILDHTEGNGFWTAVHDILPVNRGWWRSFSKAVLSMFLKFLKCLCIGSKQKNESVLLWEHRPTNIESEKTSLIIGIEALSGLYCACSFIRWQGKADKIGNISLTCRKGYWQCWSISHFRVT